jgi:hypothetical protein
MLNKCTSCLSNCDVVKLLWLGAVLVLGVNVINAVWPFIATLIDAPFSIKSLSLNIFSLALRLIDSLFSPLILIALAEIVKSKKQVN